VSPRPRILVVHPAELQTEDPRTGGQQRQALLVELSVLGTHPLSPG